MKIYDLKTNYQINPIGICLEGLTLSWKVKDALGQLQKSVHIKIATDSTMGNCCFDSGELELTECMYTPDVQLQPGITYYWQVGVTDDRGDFAESAVATFEGGHPAEKWHGKWITAPFVPELTPFFQKTFVLDGQETADMRARMYVCGLGLYEVYLNGEKVGDEYLTPYYTDYRYWIQYQTYDVGNMLKSGENRIDVFLGQGWYMSQFGYTNKALLRNYYGSEMKLLLDLYMEGSDGQKRVIGTDTDWLALKSPIAASGIYEGEVYDARMEKNITRPSERSKLKAIEATAPDAALEPMTGVGVRRKEGLKVKEIITTRTGETVLDFGQEITGWVAFKPEAPSGSKILLQYSEVMQNGVFYRDNLRMAKAEYLYFSDGEKKLARPHFTFYGFRYVKVTGMKVDASNVDDFEAWALYSDIQETGYIETSNEKLNRLIENTKWSQKDNFLDIPTDCPQRDERLGWTGDAEIFSGAASFHMQTPAFFRKYMKDMALEQREKNGAVPYVVPDILTIARLKNGEPEFDMTENLWGEAGSCVWGDAATIIPWNMYLFYGNKRLLAEQYDNMKQWVDFIIYMDENHCGGGRLWNCGFHFGDWLSLDGADRTGGTDPHLVASVYYMYSAQLTAKAAKVLGKEEDASYYEQIASEVRSAVRKHYLTAPGRFSVETQTAYVLGIYFGIFEQEEMSIAAEQLKRLLEERNDHLCTGFVGTAHLCPALSRVGLTDKAYTLLLNEDYPSWLYEVNLGATTIWERWNSLLPDGSISSTGMNSLNHYAYGVIVEWIYRYVCGLNPMEEAPGFSKVRFAPQVDKRLSYAKATYDSMYGTYEAGWRIEESRVIYHLTVPFGCEAEFCPQAGVQLGNKMSGTVDKTAKRIKINGADATEHFMNGSYIFRCGSYDIEVE